MPYYIYRHPEDDVYVEVLQGMNDEHTFFDSDGLQWKRVFTSPNVAKDILPVDPFSSKSFVKATDKKGTIGDMMSLSAELSEKRKDSEGEDPVRRKYFDNYEQRVGQKHMADKAEVVKKDRYTIDFNKPDAIKFRGIDD